MCGEARGVTPPDMSVAIPSGATLICSAPIESCLDFPMQTSYAQEYTCEKERFPKPTLENLQPGTF